VVRLGVAPLALVLLILLAVLAVARGGQQDQMLAPPPATGAPARPALTPSAGPLPSAGRLTDSPRPPEGDPANAMQLQVFASGGDRQLLIDGGDGRQVYAGVLHRGMRMAVSDHSELVIAMSNSPAIQFTVINGRQAGPRECPIPPNSRGCNVTFRTN
jgi:hypothetical protein